MAINIGAANWQASQLGAYASELRTAINNLNAYQGSLNSNWQGREMGEINAAIDSTKGRINQVAAELDALSRDVMYNANQIKREEDAAAAAALAAAQRQTRINNVRTELSVANNEANRLRVEYEKVLKQRGASNSAKQRAYNDYQNALSKVNNLQNTLNSL